MFNKIIQKVKIYFRKKEERKRQKSYVDFISRTCKTRSGSCRQMLSKSEIEQHKSDLLSLCSVYVNDDDLKSAIFEHYGKNICTNQLQALKIMAKQKQFQKNQ